MTTIFGTVGNVAGITSADEWNLRAGVTVGSISGKLKTNCRNGGSTLTFGMGETKTATVTNGTNTLTVSAHGYQTGDPVQIDYTTVPTGLVRGTNYYVIRDDNDNFRMATSVVNALSATAISITADGVGVIVWSVGPSPKAATVANATETLTVSAHGFSTAQVVQISASTVPGGLSLTSRYYVIVDDANTIRLATSPTNANAGTAINITSDGAGVYVFKLGTGTLTVTDTIDDYNYDSAVLTAHPWSSSDNFCGGVEAAAGDSNVWKDVTTDGSANASDCATTPGNCAMQDKISGLTWTKTQSTSMTWGKAMDTCKNLNFNNQASGWRLPTQKELMDAYNHGTRSAANANWITLAEMSANYFWSSSTLSYYTSDAWIVYLSTGNTDFNGKTDANQVACVR